MLVEQAIFTSARTERLDGYQLVAATEGISAEDCQSLTQWCPAHDSLVEQSAQATSVNFHPLSSENVCISRTMVAGAEYSGRGGGRVYTHCFVVTPEILAKFSNNPFRILEAISAAGHVKCHDRIPKRLEPFRLVGRASVIDRSLLRKLRSDSRCQRFPAVVAAIVSNPSLCIVDDKDPDLWLGALFSVLPAECRTQLSFCTGLQFSGRRPFRCQTRRSLDRGLRTTSQRNGIAVIDVDDPAGFTPEPLQGWAVLVHQMLTGDNLTAWERLLRCRMPGLCLHQLDALAAELLRNQRADDLEFRVTPVGV